MKRNRSLILLVDDSEFAKNTIKRAYHKCKYDFVYASNGVEAIAEIEKIQPDLILMDILMPFMDGIEATKQIKAKYDIPIIITTSLSDHQTQLISLQAGADDFVPKPIHCGILQIKIDRLLVMYDERRNQSQN